MACQQLCDKYKITLAGKKYGKAKYCSECKRYMPLNFIMCPCCNVRLRYRLRNKKRRKSLPH